MKKTAIIFLVFIYAFSVIGVAVKGDYCCNNLKSIKLVLADCSKDKEGCCKVKYQSFKVKDVHAVADILVIPVLHHTYIQSLNRFFQTNIADVQTAQDKSFHDPPLISHTPLCI